EAEEEQVESAKDDRGLDHPEMKRRGMLTCRVTPAGFAQELPAPTGYHPGAEQHGSGVQDRIIDVEKDERTSEALKAGVGSGEEAAEDEHERRGHDQAAD